MTQHHRGHTIRLTTETRKRLEAVRDALELAHRLAAQPGVAPAKVSLAHTVSAAIDLLMSVVSKHSSILEPREVKELMNLAGVSTGNGVLELLNKRGFSVELGPDGRPWLKGGAEGPVPIPAELPDASPSAGGMAEA